jgi:hypothetical protein
MKRVESESMNFSCTHQCLIFRELIATHAEHSPIFQNWRCSVSEYTDHNRFHWYMTKHLCRLQFVCKTKKKVHRKHLKKDIYGSWKLTFGLKMSSFLYLQLHFPGACKSLVHQNRKSHSCHSWSRQSVFTSKAQTLSVKAEVWLLSWDFQPRWSLFQRTKAFADPKSGCTVCSDFFQCWLGLELGLMRICEDCVRAVPTHGYFHFVINRCSFLLPSIIWSWTGNTKVFSGQFQPNELLNYYKGGATMEPINQVAL